MIGSEVASVLSDRGHEVIRASRNTGSTVDIEDPNSISDLYRVTGRIDAVVCAAGSAPMAPLDELTYADFRDGLAKKVLSQIELVRQGIPVTNDGGSFTLISGVVSHAPIRAGAVLAAANGAIDAFVRAAAVEMPRGLRINSVSPSLLTEAADMYDSAFPGFPVVPAATVARAFVRSIEGVQTGQTFRVGF
jgi:NAD(P)-dependent dehydrogenase (short-subunit alcohol dehydrogenase family)